MGASMSHKDKETSEGLTPLKVRQQDAFAHLSDEQAQKLITDLTQLAQILIDIMKQENHEPRRQVPTFLKEQAPKDNQGYNK